MPARDVLVGAALALVCLVSIPGLGAVSDNDRPLDAVAVGLMLVAAVATVARTRHPVPTLLVVAAAASGYLLLSYPYGPVLFCLTVAVWTAALCSRPAPSAVASAVACGALLLPLPVHPGALGGAIGVLPALAWVAVPYTAGLARRFVVEAQQRERAEADRRLVANERLRLAHEMHDIVGHALAAIQMQADIALHVSDHAVGQERKALTTISRASRDAMQELRTALNPTREVSAADREPPPGLGRIERLIEGVEDAGTPIRLDVRGNHRELPPDVDLAAYRLVQESLTNVVKHGTGTRAIVTVSYAADRLDLEVSNHHTAGAATGRGSGLGTASMRRRVQDLGGTFHAGHHPDEQHYVVTASLPTDLPEATR